MSDDITTSITTDSIDSPSIRYGKPMTIAAHLASLAQALANCERSNNMEWARKHRANMEWIAHNLLPSGLGIDNGTQIDYAKTTGDRVVLTLGYHFMDGSGSYAGWGDYTVIVTPRFQGLSIVIKGRNRNGIKDYLTDVFSMALSEQIWARYDVGQDTTDYESTKG